MVDDDADIRDLLRELLKRRGFAVEEAKDGQEALRVLYAARPDLVVLDAAMPRLDGWQTLDRIRELSDVPVLMLTARASEDDKIRGLRGGADDYVTKPFGREELLARVDGLLRRSAPPGTAVQDTYRDALIEIDFSQRSVTVAGRPIDVTPLEFRLLTTFVRHPNQVLSHDQLLELAWDNADVSPDQVKLYVGYLRRKLADAAPDASSIETRRGFGYSYRPPRTPAGTDA